MGSFISWLDFSEEDQRKARELMKLTENRDTIDDLGIATVRDAISNALFPGTSVVQTRPRYFLFIPWLFKRAESHPDQLIDRSKLYEKKLIVALSRADDTRGVIGIEAGANLANLPSAIYWSGLARYGIFLAPSLTLRQYARHVARGLVPADTEDEVADRSISFWQREVPEPPPHFFDFEEANLDLTHDEAEWLCERIMSSDRFGEPNLLSAFVRDIRRGRPAPREEMWEATLPADTPEAMTRLFHHAERFSCAVRGAALLYNVMLAEELAEVAPPDFNWRDPLEDGMYYDLLDTWQDSADAVGLSEWAANIEALWECVRPYARIPQRAQDFVNDWAAILAKYPQDIASSKPARQRIREREVQHKRGQARFANQKRLLDWTGRSGIRELTFRWQQVHDILEDIADGLGSAEGDHAVA